MLGVGEQFPSFELIATVSNDLKDCFKKISNETYKDKWLVLFFWPKDFTFVCPTEILSFSDLKDEFANRNAQVLGCSTDNEFVHLAWRKDALKDVQIPMMSDIKRDLCGQLGIIDQNHGVAQRATYIIDPKGTIRFVMVTDMNIGRSSEEVLRVLDALQTDGLCPCNWKKGQNTLHVA